MGPLPYLKAAVLPFTGMRSKGVAQNHAPAVARALSPAFVDDQASWSARAHIGGLSTPRQAPMRSCGDRASGRA